MAVSKTKIFKQDEFDLLIDVTNSILGNLSLDSLFQECVEIVIHKYGFLGGLLFLIEDGDLYVKIVNKSKLADVFKKLIARPVRALRIKLDSKNKNSVLKAVLTKEIQFSFDLYDFTRGVLPKKLTEVISKATGTRSNIALPIVYEGKSIGALFFSKSVRKDYKKEMNMLRLLSNQMGIAIVNARLYQESVDQVKQLELKNKQLQTLFEIINTVTKRSGTDEALQLVVDVISKNLDYPLVILNILDRETNELKGKAVSHFDTLHPRGEGISHKDVEKYIKSGKCFLRVGNEVLKFSNKHLVFPINKAYSGLSFMRVSKYFKKNFGVSSVVSVPLKLRDEVIGSLDFWVKSPVDEVNQEDIKIMKSINAQFGVAIDNAQLFTTLRKREIFEALKNYHNPQELEKNELLNLEIVKNSAEKNGISRVEALRRIIEELIDYLRPKEVGNGRTLQKLKYEIARMIAYDQASESQIMWDLGFEVENVKFMQDDIGGQPRFPVKNAKDYSAMSVRSFKRIKSEVMDTLMWRLEKMNRG